MVCIAKLARMRWHEVVFGKEEDWDGFDSKNTDLEEDEDNLPKLRAGIGQALDREHSKTMQGIKVKHIELT
jgi:hypothetical protein